MTLRSFGALSVLTLTIAATCGCGSSKKSTDDGTTTTGTTYTWATDIAPIVKSTCSASGCHGTANPGSTVFENSESAFVAKKADIKTRLNLGKSDPQYMPQNGTISDADRTKIITFLK